MMQSAVPNPMNSYWASRPVTLGFAKLLFLLIAQIPALTAGAPTALQRVWANRAVEGEEPEDPRLWLYLSVSTVLVLLGGAFAGLTIALMGQVLSSSLLLTSRIRSLMILIQ